MSDELLKTLPNGQWELLEKRAEKPIISKHGDYTLHSSSAGYTDTDTGDGTPKDVNNHEVYHKGKHLGSVHSVEAKVIGGLDDKHSSHHDKVSNIISSIEE